MDEMTGKSGKRAPKMPLSDRQSEMRVRVKRRKTPGSGRKKGSLNQKTKDSRAWAWAMLRWAAADARLKRIIDKASPAMQARIVLAWMQLAYGEPQVYERPNPETGKVIAAARARVDSLQEPKPQLAPDKPAAAPTFREWLDGNGLKPPPAPAAPEDPAPRRRRRIVVQ